MALITGDYNSNDKPKEVSKDDALLESFSLFLHNKFIEPSLTTHNGELFHIGSYYFTIEKLIEMYNERN